MFSEHKHRTDYLPALFSTFYVKCTKMLISLKNVFLNLDLFKFSFFIFCSASKHSCSLTACIQESGESASPVGRVTWEAFRCHWHTDSLSNCVQQIRLTFCLSVLSGLPGGNVLMSYLPAWLMISKSPSSCSAKNREEKGSGVVRTYWDTPETPARASQWEAEQMGNMELPWNAYCILLLLY